MTLDIAVYFLDKTLLVFTLLHFVLQGQTYLLFQVSLDFLLYIPIPSDVPLKRTSFLVLVLEDVVGLYRNSQLPLLWHYVLGINLDYCDIE